MNDSPPTGRLPGAFLSILGYLRPPIREVIVLLLACGVVAALIASSVVWAAQ